MSEEKKDNPEVLPPALVEFGEWLKQNWFTVSLVIIMIALVIGVILVARRR